MDIIKRLVERHRKARADIGALLEQADEALATKDVERAAELEQQAEAAHGDAAQLEKRIDKLREQGELRQYDVVRRDTSLGNDTTPNTPGKSPQSSTRDMDVPTPDDIVTRDMLAVHLSRGHALSEEQTVQACRIYPVEQLWGRVMVERSGMTEKQGIPDLLTVQQRAAYREYQKNVDKAIEMRALSNPLTPATATQGSEFVPTVLAREIFKELDFVGPLSGDALLNVFRLDYWGNLDIPKVTSQGKAAPLATGVDVTISRPVTALAQFRPIKYSYAVAVNYELLIGDYVNLMTFLSTYMSEGFGRAYNEDRTVGTQDDNNRIQGAFSAALDANTPRTAGKTGLVEADLIKLYNALETRYYGRPRLRMMFTGTTEMEILKMRETTGGNRIFPLNPATGRAVLYRNIQYMINEDMDDFVQASGNAQLNLRVLGMGDFSRYGVFYCGGLRAGSEYQAVSDQILLTMHAQTDGRIMDDAAFHVVATPSS